jgi:hypothetical protein
MSTLNVESISHPTSGSLATINGTAPSNRNLIINGAMTVHQRGSDITVTGYIADRWRFNASSLDQWAGDATWETDAPAGFSRSIKMNTTTAEMSFEGGDELSFETRIEAQDLQHLDWGTANAKSLTLSFWVKCNKTGTQSIHVRAHDASDGYSTSYSINSADTWEYKTIVISGNTAGSINNDNGIGIWIRWIAADGNTAVTEDAWDTSNIGPYAVSGAMAFGTTIGDYLQITGVQLEVGSVATPFEHRSYGDELARCQRYYHKIKGGVENDPFANGINWDSPGTAAVFQYFFPVEMRTKPTALEQSGTASDYKIAYRTTAATCSSGPTYGGRSTRYTTEIGASISSGMTQGDCVSLRAKTANAYLAWSAEL